MRPPRTHVLFACAALAALSLASAILANSKSPASPAAAPQSDGIPVQRPLYYDRLITQKDLRSRSLRELTLMRNTIFARAGNPFRKKWLADYFAAQPWYHPLTATDESKLTPLDKQNAGIIVAYDLSLSRSQLQTMVGQIMIAVRDHGFTPEDRIELRLLSARLGKWVGPSDTPEDERSPLEDPAILDKQLTVDQLKDLSRRDLRLLRNTIYARHGRQFRSELLRSYFEATDWYKSDSAYTDALLTAVDNRNIKLIRSLEDQLGGPLTDFEHRNEDGWIVQS
jgi:hypothetical protein